MRIRLLLVLASALFLLAPAGANDPGAGLLVVARRIAEEPMPIFVPRSAENTRLRGFATETYRNAARS